MWIDAAWAVIILAFAGLEAWALHEPSHRFTFSERLRDWFNVQTRSGAFVFIAVLGTAAAWLSAHIIEIGI